MGDTRLQKPSQTTEAESLFESLFGDDTLGTLDTFPANQVDSDPLPRRRSLARCVAKFI